MTNFERGERLLQWAVGADLNKLDFEVPELTASDGRGVHLVHDAMLKEMREHVAMFPQGAAVKLLTVVAVICQNQAGPEKSDTFYEERYGLLE